MMIIDYFLSSSCAKHVETLIFFNFFLFWSRSHSKSPKPQKPKGKQNRVWNNGGSSTRDLDYSDKNGNGSPNGAEQNLEAQFDPVFSGL